MTKTSLKVLESWRNHAREEYWLHQFAGYRPRYVASNYWAQVQSLGYTEFERSLLGSLEAVRFLGWT